MPDQISFRLNSLPGRLILFVPALVVLVAFIFVGKWSVANSAATRAQNIEIADLTTVWGPDDPQTHFTRGVLYEKSFLPGDLEKAVQSYEKAAGASPYDFRYWMPLAQARERSGDAEAAEKTLRYALKLAPNYAQLHWSLGNVLLREGRSDEAFAEMREALERNPIFAAPAASTALQVSGEDHSTILQKLGNSSAIKAAMTLTLAQQQKFNEGMSIWNTIPYGERESAFKENGNELFNVLMSGKSFRNALQMRSVPDQDQQSTLGKFSNAGFEEENISTDSPFGWKVADGAQPRIGLSSEQKHGGERSLGIIFAKSSGKDFRPVSQMLVVESNTSYRLKIFIYSKIKSTSALHWEVADAASESILAATKEIADETAGWQELTADFKTGEQTEAVVIRLTRTGCQNCSIEGRIWFDDLSLEKL